MYVCIYLKAYIRDVMFAQNLCNVTRAQWKYIPKSLKVNISIYMH